mmetsp:Transcript_85909/g.135633  ORF Transcript_85909/g.135633 Transcript_85909/m.135633 type:complete len:147 (-) Transcript_85909:198-638(-)|eukprot:CAMPEP_0169132086 /NCGR_PEP_ID=MMETSP1015-20121227/38602_1 /TAXON_ID=342587 /ORGANISM="Karlodinium micrum, Strain CCMP2283" /LENGTH=146 /DNA_ID=CAMNT_0009196409 /DNA_START=47 /DNA_END=487 /DNA_ORIENTATION=+
MAALPVAADQKNGCNHEFDAKKAEAEGVMKKDDPIQDHYKKTGMWGSFTGMFGDKKTMWCHHLTNDGKLSVREAKAQGKTFTSVDDVWTFLGKDGKCCGRYAYDSKKGMLICGPCVKKDHDNTCNADTCLFVASGLECPIPKDAFK